jgi:hypothetical protein
MSCPDGSISTQAPRHTALDTKCRNVTHLERAPNEMSRHITIDGNCQWLEVLEVVRVWLFTVFKEPEHCFEQPDAIVCLLVHHDCKQKAIRS